LTQRRSEPGSIGSARGTNSTHFSASATLRMIWSGPTSSCRVYVPSRSPSQPHHRSEHPL